MLLRRFRTVLLVLAALVSSLALLAGCSRGGPPAPASSSRPAVAARTVPGRPSAGQLASAFARLETRFHAHLGVYVLDTGTGRTVSFQAGRRFAFCSTYKVLATGVLLRQGAPLDRVIRYRAADLVDYSPITSQHVATGMTLAAVMQAALEYSDNTAANLLLVQLGARTSSSRICAISGTAPPTPTATSLR